MSAKSAAELELDPVVERRAQVAGEREPLDQSVGSATAPRRMWMTLRGSQAVAAERQVVHREVDLSAPYGRGVWADSSTGGPPATRSR